MAGCRQVSQSPDGESPDEQDGQGEATFDWGAWELREATGPAGSTGLSRWAHVHLNCGVGMRLDC